MEELRCFLACPWDRHRCPGHLCSSRGQGASALQSGQGWLTALDGTATKRAASESDPCLPPTPAAGSPIQRLLCTWDCPRRRVALNGTGCRSAPEHSSQRALVRHLLWARFWRQAHPCPQGACAGAGCVTLGLPRSGHRPLQTVRPQRCSRWSMKVEGREGLRPQPTADRVGALLEPGSPPGRSPMWPWLCHL